MLPDESLWVKSESIFDKKKDAKKDIAFHMCQAIIGKHGVIETPKGTLIVSSAPERSTTSEKKKNISVVEI
jgi:hypothetical protein